MKNNNPLYVVKNDHIEEAKNFIDLLVKKFNLDPVVEFLNTILKILLDSVQSYSAFLVVQEFVDLIVQKLELFRKYSIV